MLERIAALLRALAPEAPVKARPVFDDADHRVAAAGLLVHAVNVDGVKSPVEMRRLEALLSERFALDPAEVKALIAAADARDRESVDLSGFTGIVRRAYNADGKRRIVEMMWQIVFADGELHEFEDAMVWRVAEMIGVPTEERRAVRRSVAEAAGIPLTDEQDS